MSTSDGTRAPAPGHFFYYGWGLPFGVDAIHESENQSRCVRLGCAQMYLFVAQTVLNQIWQDVECQLGHDLVERNGRHGC